MQLIDNAAELSDIAHIENVASVSNVTNSPAHPEHAFRFAFGGYHPAASRAYELHRSRAAAMGQVWSEGHASAFRELHHAYNLVGLGLGRGRTAWPLAVGTGKTQSLVAFALAQCEAEVAGGSALSLLVCIERVDHIRDLYREMVEAGVPADRIAVYHRKTAREVTEESLVPASTPEQIDRALFLIATHALMLRGEDGIALVNTYRGHERSLVVWDESLIKSQGRHFDLADIEGALGFLQPIVRDALGDHAEDARGACEYVSRCTTVLREEFTRAVEGHEPRTAALPALSAEDETRFLVGIVEALRGGDEVRLGVRRRLVEFIEHVQRPVRVVPYVERGRRVGVVHYLTRIPESLSRLIVLDASHNIRLLTSEHDSSLRVTEVDCAVKSFEDVTVRQYIQGAGRDKLDTELARSDSATVRRLMETLRDYPADEGVIVATFKLDAREERRGKKSNADQLRRHMRKAGIDPDASLPDGRPRFVFLTWGQHVGVSEYAYCRHCLAVGVLRRDVLDVASHIAGQRGDLLAPQAADPAEVSRVVLSEMFHHVVQFAGRGACRTTVNGRAARMTLTLLCVETFPADWWQAAMPGVSVQEIRPGARERAAKASEAEQAIMNALASLPADLSEVSARTLKVAAGLREMSPKAYSRLLASLKVTGWRREGRGFVRERLTFEPVEGGYTQLH